MAQRVLVAGGLELPRIYDRRAGQEDVQVRAGAERVVAQRLPPGDWEGGQSARGKRREGWWGQGAGLAQASAEAVQASLNQ